MQAETREGGDARLREERDALKAGYAEVKTLLRQSLEERKRMAGEAEALERQLAAGVFMMPLSKSLS